MKKNLLISAISFVLSLSISCTIFAQAPTTEGGKVGPWIENAENANAGANSDRYIGDGATVYDTQTGMYTPNPNLFPNSSENSSNSTNTDNTNTSSNTGASDCDPINQGWEAALNAAAPTVAIGGDQGIKMESAYQDTQNLGTTLIGGGLSGTPQTE